MPMALAGLSFVTGQCNAMALAIDPTIYFPQSCALLGQTFALIRTAFGYADWWKLHALVYMLRHPREAYRTREVRAHLATLGLRISSLDFRRFCKRHGIRRNERAGRPRIRAAHAAR